MGQSLAERKRNVRTRQLCPHFPLLDTAGLAGMAGKIRKPKQIPMNKGASPQNRAAAGGLIGRVLRICHLNLVLVSDFEFRISDLSSQGSRAAADLFTCHSVVAFGLLTVVAV